MQATVFEITTIALTGGISAAILLRAMRDQLTGKRRLYLRSGLFGIARGA